MLKKSRRLTTFEVQQVLAKGRSKRATFLSMKHLSTPVPLKTSVVVSKSVAKKATERNRLRRSVYRALSRVVGKGKMLIFVQKIPPQPITSAFASDLSILIREVQ